MAKESQYLAAMNVEPRAPVMIGTRHFALISAPNEVSMFTFGNTQSSGSLVMPSLRPLDP